MSENECPGHFTCAHCGGEFTKIADWDPAQEAKDRWGSTVKDPVSICDDCDKQIQAWLATPAGQQALREWNEAGRP